MCDKEPYFADAGLVGKLVVSTFTSANMLEESSRHEILDPTTKMVIDRYGFKTNEWQHQSMLQPSMSLGLKSYASCPLLAWSH